MKPGFRAGARVPRSLAEPRIRPGVVGLFRFIAPAYMKAVLGFDSLEMRHPERVVRAYEAFFKRESRLLIAFRHPYGDEAQVVAYLVGKMVGRAAAAMGVPLPRTPHAIFVHGYEVPLWGGPLERWLLPRVGALPVYHAKMNRDSMARIRAAMKDGEYPLALAPEGQVSYTSEALPRIESGAARICAWCVEDLAREGRNERVEILPISIHHHWGQDAEAGLDKLIARMEAECGLASPGAAAPPARGSSFPERHTRLLALADRILGLAERHYSLMYGFSLPEPGNPGRRRRLECLMEAALATAEKALGLVPEGDRIQRVYAIRQVCWDRMFPAELAGQCALSPLERALADRAAGEAWYASRHMEFVDLAWYLDFERLEIGDPLELYIEAAQNCFDLISRLSGGNISDRASVRGKKALLSIGEPIDASRTISESGSGRKAAVAELTGQLARAFLDLAEEHRAERRAGFQARQP
ncbi:MAG TPA: hypothetical protein VIO60_01715 [Rectinemataceae bacterium]